MHGTLEMYKGYGKVKEEMSKDRKKGLEKEYKVTL